MEQRGAKHALIERWLGNGQRVEEKTKNQKQENWQCERWAWFFL